MRNGTTVLGAPEFHHLLIGGGGFVIDVDVCQTTGRKVIACDVSPGQWRDPVLHDRWQDMLTHENTAGIDLLAPTPDVHYSGTGSFAAAISDSNPDVMMVSYFGLVIRTTDAWATASKINVGPKKMRSNDSMERMWASKMAIHSTNPNIFMFGTQMDNVWYSLDGGATVNNIGMSPPTITTTTISSSINNSTTSIPVAAGTAASFPALTGSNFFWGIVGDEFVKVTGVSGDTFTVVRGQQGRAGTAYPSGTSFSLYPYWLSGVIPHLVAFDPGNPSYCYASNPGSGPGTTSGIWRSSTGPGGTWAQVTGGPKVVCSIHVASDGTVYVCDAGVEYNDLRRLWKLARGGSTWTEITPSEGNGGPTTVTSDPANPAHLFGAHNDAYLEWFSYDAGATWVPFTGNQRIVARDLKWLEAGVIYASHADWSAADGKIYLSHGRGVLQCTPKASGDGSQLVWTDYSLGNEMLGMPDIFTAPGVSVIAQFLDKSMMRPKNLRSADMRPIVPGFPVDAGAVTHCWCIDYEPGNPQHLVSLVTYGGFFSGFSNDGGETWAQFGSPTHPDVALLGASPYGGCIVRTGPTHIIWCPGNNGRVVRSTDLGTTWLDLSIGGVTPVESQNSLLWLNRHNFCSDKEQPGHVAFIGRNEGNPVGGLPLAAVWHSTDHGATWTKKCAAHPLDPYGTSEQFWGCKMSYIPGNAGKLLYTVGQFDAPGSRFLRSDDDGATWNWVRSGVNGVIWFSFGKGLPGSQWPAVYYMARTGGTTADPVAVYATFDMFATAPIQVVPHLKIPLVDLQAIGGDLNILGRIWVGINAQGMGFYDIKDVRALT